MEPNDLRQMRKSLGLTQTQLGKELGISRRQIVEWETGKRPIRRMVDLALRMLESCTKP
jgi:DNA-binding XRE family transcriptional regulator